MIDEKLKHDVAVDEVVVVVDQSIVVETNLGTSESSNSSIFLRPSNNKC